MAEETTFSLAPIQQGIDLTNVWTDVAFPMRITPTNQNSIGFRFDLGVTTDATTGRALGPLRPFTTTADTIASVAARPFTFTIFTTNTAQPDFDFYLDGDPAPGTISTANRFFPLSGTGFQNLAPTRTEVDGVNNWRWDIQTTDTLDNIFTPITTTDDALFEHFNDPLWDGTMNFWLVIGFGSFVAYDITSATITGQSIPFWTGTPSLGSGKRDRVVLDDRFGMPTYAGDLVEDGESHGRWVRAKDWDPEIEESTYPGSPLEGDDDDLPVK